MRLLIPCLFAVATLQAQTEDLVNQASVLSNEGRHSEAVTVLERSAAAEPGPVAAEGAAVAVVDIDGTAAEAVAGSIRDAGGRAIAIAAE